MKKVALEDAIGLRLGHDLTEVNITNKTKRRAFKKGHIISRNDLDRLRDLGKNQLYVFDGIQDEVHEDEAALEAAPLIAGENITFDPEPSEGKISFYAACDGLFKVDSDRLYQINALEIPSLPTLHSNFPVKANKQVAAFRIIPLFCKPEIMEKVKSELAEPLIHVKPFIFQKAGIIVTGNEVFEGRIKDAFIPRIRQVLKHYSVDVVRKEILPDQKAKISKAIKDYSKVCDIIFVTGGTSIDPDDQTVAALTEAGVIFENKGNPVQPGNNFTVGYKNKVVVCAVPAAAIFHKATALNIFLPRLLAGEKIEKVDFFRAGHGGLCHFCKKCHFPICPFAVAN